MKILALLLGLASLTSCVTQYEHMVNNCAGYGFEQGTLPFAYCMQQEEVRRQQFWQNLGEIGYRFNESQNPANW